jgi:hypothetical protein
MAKLADPRDVVASGCGRRGSRGLICPLVALTALPASRPRAQPTEGAAGDPALRNVVASGCRTGQGTYSRTRLVRFTQDRTPTCSVTIGPREKVFGPGRLVPLDRNAKVRVMMVAARPDAPPGEEQGLRQD